MSQDPFAGRPISPRNRVASVVLTSLVLFGNILASAQTQNTPPPRRPALSLLVLSAPAFADGTAMPDKFGWSPTTPAVSPQLSWRGAPEGTQSFVLLMRDEEYAPGKSFAPFYHWIIFNIPGSATGLPEAVPAEKKLSDGSVQPQNGRFVGYNGPGAPSAGQPHHYTLTLYALDTKIDLGPAAAIDEITKSMDGHILDKGFLVGLYHQKPAQ